MKLGVIGSGKIVQEFLPQMRELPGVEIAVLQGTRRSQERVERLCRENGVPRAVYDFEALAQSGVDTVYVAVPNDLHFAYCRQALEKGLHVIVEKPMASNEKEAALLEQIAEEKGLFLFEAVTTLYLPVFQKIREWLPRLGTVKIVQSQFCKYSSRYDAFMRGETPPAFDAEKSGGALMDLQSYNLHFVMGLFGEPVELLYHANLDRGVDTSGILTLQYPQFQAVCVAAKDCPGESGILIQGTQGYIKSELAPNALGKATLRLRGQAAEEFCDGMEKKRLLPEFTAFERAIREKDREFCKNMLKKSMAVCRAQTKARLQAGVIFPADGE